MPERLCRQCKKPIEHWQTICADCAEIAEQERIARREAHKHEMQIIECLRRGEDPHQIRYEF